MSPLSFIRGIPSGSKWNYLFLFYIILIEAVNKLFIKFDGACRIPLMIMVFSFLMNTRNREFKRMLSYTPFIIWFIWVVYTTLRTWYSGFPISEDNVAMPLYTRIFKYVSPLYTMVLVCWEGYKDNKRLCLFMISVFSLYIIMGLLFQERGDGSGSGWSSRGMMDLGNSLALNAFVYFFFLISAFSKKYIGKIVVIFMVLALMSIFFVATRKALAGVFVIMACYLFSIIDLRKKKTVFLIIIGFVFAYISYDYIMQNTLLGSRFGDSISAKDVGVYSDNMFFSFVGDRAIQYILAWDVFIDNPIFGIGLDKFMDYTDFPMPIHSEYMVQIAECGVIGIFLFLLFYTTLIKRLLLIKSKNKSDAWVCLGGIGGLLFMSFTTWTYSDPYFFSLIGFVICICYNYSYKKKKNVAY